MFENIGKKIKIFAKVLFWIGVCIFGILAIVVASKEDSFFAFLLIAGIGVLVSYLSVIVLYMLGQLVDNSDIVASNSEKLVCLLKEVKAGLSERGEEVSKKTRQQIELLEQIRFELACGNDDQAAEEEPTETAKESPAEQAEGIADEPVCASVSIEEEPDAPTDVPEFEPVPTITCKVCGYALTDDDCDLSDSVFCPNCGSKLSEQAEPEGVCPGCGFNKAFGKFCPRCGLRLHE